MAEEWGSVVIKASEDILKELESFKNKDAIEVVRKLGTFACIDLGELVEVNASINEVDNKSGYVKLNFDCSEWRSLSGKFVKDGKNIEWYARITDEYGTAYFYSLDESGNKHEFSFDMGGDLCELEEYVDEALNNIEAWKASLTEPVKLAFPDFVDTDDIDFDGP